MVEDSGLFELQLRDSLIDNLVTSESMPSWQKSYLPRMSKYHVFRFESPVSDHSINLDKVESDLGETTIQLPDLVWLAKPNRHQAKLKIEIDRISVQPFEQSTRFSLLWDRIGTSPYPLSFHRTISSFGV